MSNKIKTKEWLKIEAKNAPAKRCAHTSSFYKNKLYIFPGFEFDGTSTPSTDLPFFDFSTKEWNSITPENNTPRRQQAISFNYKNNFYLFGGSYDTSFFDGYL